jgi:hypothetical protein
VAAAPLRAQVLTLALALAPALALPPLSVSPPLPPFLSLYIRLMSAHIPKFVGMSALSDELPGLSSSSQMADLLW